MEYNKSDGSVTLYVSERYSMLTRLNALYDLRIRPQVHHLWKLYSGFGRSSI